MATINAISIITPKHYLYYNNWTGGCLYFKSLLLSSHKTFVDVICGILFGIELFLIFIV